MIRMFDFHFSPPVMEVVQENALPNGVTAPREGHYPETRTEKDRNHGD
jgi:hypothetical protein